MVERDSGKPMMSGFHAFYSIGGAVGAAAMTALLSLQLAPLWVCVLGSLSMLVVLALSVRYWRRDRAPSDAPVFAVPHGVVLAIGVLCFVAFLAEGAMLDWSAVFLHEVQQVPPDRAGLGFMTFAIAMTVTRWWATAWWRSWAGCARSCSAPSSVRWASAWPRSPARCHWRCWAMR